MTVYTEAVFVALARWTITLTIGLYTTRFEAAAKLAIGRDSSGMTQILSFTLMR